MPAISGYAREAITSSGALGLTILITTLHSVTWLSSHLSLVNDLSFMSAGSAPEKTMRAVLIKDGVGSADNLYIGERPVPSLNTTPVPGQAGGAEVLVQVKAFGLNRMDILQREGKYPLPPGTTDILGVEFSGTVVEVGPAPHNQQDGYHPHVGDAVFGLALGGAYAEFIKVRASLLLPKPSELSWEQAAAIPENWFTAYQALRTIAGLRPPSEWSADEKFSRRQVLGLDPTETSSDPSVELQDIGKDVLIHAGASGVGLAAIQLARDLGARKVFATASTQKVDVCVKKAGADAAFDYKTVNWAEALSEHNGLKGPAAKAGSVDVIVDFIGGTYWNKNLASARRDGRIVLLGTMGGTHVKEDAGADVVSLVIKRLRVEGSTLRSRSLAYQSELVQDFLAQGILDRILAGLKPGTAQSEATRHEIIIHKVLPWTQIQDAHRLMEADANIGKIIATTN